MKIALAQIEPIKGNIPANITRHIEAIYKAVLHDSSAIFFPELSLTGYEPTIAASLAMDPKDERLKIFQTISNESGICIGIGLPCQTGQRTTIGMHIYQPNMPMTVYSKQHLHPDEFPYFDTGKGQAILSVHGLRLAPAICYESLLESHLAAAHLRNIDVYLASVAKSSFGMEKARFHYPAIAKRYHIYVLVVNCTGSFDGMETAGGSAVWDRNGSQVAELDDPQEGMLIFDTSDHSIVKL